MSRARRELLGAVWCVCWLGACGAPEPAEEEAKVEPVAVTCAEARSGTIAATVTLQGVVHPPPEREVVVAPLIAGRLIEVSVHEGDRVTPGQALARVDDPQLAAAVVEAHAAASSARAAAENSRAVVERAQRLFADGIAARREVDDARTASAGAEAELEASRSREQLAAAQRARAAVTSPIAGVVLKLLRTQGDLVDGTSQTPLAIVADPALLELRADAPAAALVQLSEGAQAEIRLDAIAGDVLHGRVVKVAPGVDAQTGLGSVRVAIDAPGERVKIGLAGRADVQAEARAKATLIPSSALRRSGSGQEEVVVCAAGPGATAKAEVRAVQVGARSPGVVEIRDGVRPGERVVVDQVLGLGGGAELAPRAGAAP